MASSSPLRVLDAARIAVDEVNRWLDEQPASVPDSSQLREAAGSITSNIREAYGHDLGPERNRFLRYARGSAEETDERLRTVLGSKRISEKEYWSHRNRLVVIIRMLTALMKRPKPRNRRRKRQRRPRSP